MSSLDLEAQVNAKKEAKIMKHPEKHHEFPVDYLYSFLSTRAVNSLEKASNPIYGEHKIIIIKDLLNKDKKYLNRSYVGMGKATASEIIDVLIKLNLITY